MKIDDIINGLRQAIESEKLAGINEVHMTKEVTRKKAEAESDSGMTLEKLENKVKGCYLCPLGDTRTNVVFGEGNPNAELMFIGEAPGAEEDKQGRPFVGRAGQLLTKIIESIGLKREDVFIGNILKCRPPGNRNPLPSEIIACTPYLLEQIKFINPKVICTLGKFASQTLIQSDTPISRLRGKLYDYQGVKLMPTYHPAYLLRNSSGKKDVWEDMKLVAKELGLKIPKKG